MLICKNCGSTNVRGVIKCTTCSMKGMLVEITKKEKNKQDTIKPIYSSCPNCGTSETGNNEKCQKCNFPLPVDSRSREKSKNSHPKKNIL